MKITKLDYIKAVKKADREIEMNNGFKCVNKIHKSEKVYSRKRNIKHQKLLFIKNYETFETLRFLSLKEKILLIIVLSVLIMQILLIFLSLISLFNGDNYLFSLIVNSLFAPINVWNISTIWKIAIQKEKRIIEEEKDKFGF